MNEEIKIEDFDIEKSRNSYMTKEEFIKMLSELHFKYIEYADINFITDFMLKINNDKKYIDRIGFEIKIS